MWFTYAILSAVFAAVTAILTKLGLEKINSTLAYAIRAIFVVGFVWMIVFAQKLEYGLSEVTHKSWIFLFFSALATGLSWLFYFKAMQLGDASKVAPVDKLSVIMTIIFAGLFLGEKITWQVFAGAFLMTAGTVLIAIAK